MELLSRLSKAMNSPFSLHWTEYSVRCLLLFTAGYGIIALAVSSSRKNRRRGAEHGSAQWGDVFQTAKRYGDKKNPRQNLILTQHFADPEGVRCTSTSAIPMCWSSEDRAREKAGPMRFPTR
ncbi:MAG: hypothetical protein ACLT1K_11315 [[Clostridium] leptum]